MLPDPVCIIQLVCIGFYAAQISGTLAASNEFKFIRAPQNVFVVKDQPFVWPCDITTAIENGPVTFYWTKDGVNITSTTTGSASSGGASSSASTDRRVVWPNGALYFREISHRKRRGLSDEGVYRCVATNRLGSIVSPHARLRVAVLSRFTSAPSNSDIATTGTGGSDTTGTGGSDTTGTGGNAENSAATAAGNGDGADHGGTGAVSPTTTDGSSGPAVSTFNTTVSTTTITAYHGDVLRLVCNISGEPAPTVLWEKDRSELPLQLMGNKYHTLESSGTLHITNLTWQDEGLYRCVARNMASERRSSEVRVIINERSVYRAPEIVSPHHNVTVLSGANVTLECLVTGWPRPNVYWTRQNGAFVLDNSRFRQRADGSLVIVHIAHADTGIYICHADSKPFFSMDYTISATVRVLVPPVFKIRPKAPETTLFYGYPLLLDCRVLGMPVPRITWYKDARPLNIHGRVKTHHSGSELEVGQCQPADAGYYQCFAENEAGIIESSSFVMIKEPPHHSEPPVNVSVVTVTNTTIRIRWLTPPTDFPIIAFSVHHFPVIDGQEHQTVVGPSHQAEQQYTVNDLLPFTNYTVYVVAYTPQGASEHSRYIYQTTAEGVPSAGPAVIVSPSSPSTMQIDWQPLAADRAHGVISQYRLVYRSQGLAKAVVHIPAQENSYLLTGLQPGTQYSVRVEAATRVGYNLNPTEKQWPWIMAHTPTSIPINAPDPPIASLSANHTSITAVWEEPSDDEPISEYRLICFDLSAQSDYSVTLDTTARQHVFDQLTPGLWYEVTISAKNRYGFGREVSHRIQTLAYPSNVSSGQPTNGPPIPLPPIGIKVSPVSSSRVRITWTDVVSEQPIVRYSILYYMVEQNPTVQVQEHYRDSSSDVQAAILGDLEPYTEYEIAIQSHTQAAKSAYSKKQRFMTLEGVPSPPEDLTGQARRPGMVELKWRPPERTNGVIVSYIIMYNVDDNQNENMWFRRTHNGSSTSALIDDLEADKTYFFKLIATTKAGSGPPTPPLRVAALCAGPDCPAVEHGDQRAPEHVDRTVGIGIGVGIALGSIVICIIIIVIKHRCSGRTSAATTQNHNGHVNGDVRAVYCPRPTHNGHVPNGVEIESYLPMLPELKENSASDTKGGVVQVRVRTTGPGTTSILTMPTRQESQRVHLLAPSAGHDSNQISGRPVSLNLTNTSGLSNGGPVAIDDPLHQQQQPRNTHSGPSSPITSRGSQPTNHDRSSSDISDVCAASTGKDATSIVGSNDVITDVTSSCWRGDSLCTPTSTVIGRGQFARAGKRQTMSPSNSTDDGLHMASTTASSPQTTDDYQARNFLPPNKQLKKNTSLV